MEGDDGLERPDRVGREVAEELFRAINARDIEAFHAQFHDDSVIEYPQSGERIVGGENRRGVYASFPARPSVRRIHSSGRLATVEASVDYGDGLDWRALFILELRDAKIAKLICYWAKPFPPAESRAAFVEPTDT